MGDNDLPGEKIMTDTTTTPKPAPTREASPPFRPRMLTETEIEALKQKQREMNEHWPNVRYLP